MEVGGNKQSRVDNILSISNNTDKGSSQAKSFASLSELEWIVTLALISISIVKERNSKDTKYEVYQYR